MLNLTINQDNLYLLIPSKMGWLASMLSDDEDISVVDAIKKLYESDMYKRLEDEKTKAWHLGPVALYEEFIEEYRNKTN